MSVVEYGFPGYHSRVGLMPLDGATSVAFEFYSGPNLGTSQCVVGGTGFGATTASINVTHALDASNLEELFLLGPLAGGSTWTQVAARLGPITYLISGFYVDGQSIVTGPADGLVLRSDPATGRFSTVVVPGGPPGSVCCGTPQGPLTFFVQDSPNAFWITDGSSQSRMIYTPPTGATTTANLAVDSQVVWGLAYGSPGAYTQQELWAATFPGLTGVWAPRRVSGVPLTTVLAFFSVGAGRFVYAPGAATQGYIIESLSDGTYWALNPLPGENYDSVAYIADSEIAINVRHNGTAGIATVERITFASLGPASPPMP